MGHDDERARPGRIRRTVEELRELWPTVGDAIADRPTVLEELDYARVPAVHERRIPSYGALVEPTVPTTAWGAGTDLGVELLPVTELARRDARRFADGLSSWLVYRAGAPVELAVFDRPAGSERDLVVLAGATGATVVQRHPAGVVRVVDEGGVVRWDGLRWHHEPPVGAWIDAVRACAGHGARDVLETLLEFAVHDLGARGIGALLVYRTDEDPPSGLQDRHPTPPPLHIDRPIDLAPLRHVLAQTDGAAVFDRGGVLTHLGARLVPTPVAEADVDGFRGMRHTAGRRYSFDDPLATVIVVSEDGPVTVWRNGELLGRSEPDPT